MILSKEIPSLFASAGNNGSLPVGFNCFSSKSTFVICNSFLTNWSSSSWTIGRRLGQFLRYFWYSKYLSCALEFFKQFFRYSSAVFWKTVFFGALSAVRSKQILIFFWELHPGSVPLLALPFHSTSPTAWLQFSCSCPALANAMSTLKIFGKPKNPENGESESGFIMSLFCLSYIINLKLGQASYAITNEICNEFFLALENLVTQPPQPSPSSPNFRSFSADLFLKLFNISNLENKNVH